MTEETKMTEILMDLPLDSVIPTPDNPRAKPKPTDPDIQELAKSIAGRGLVNPVLCRPHPEQEGCYDLRCGERRLVAHQAAGLPTIRAIVREMSDQEAKEATAVENLQREDLTPIEESKGVQLLLDGGWDVKAIASNLGKTERWVHLRANLQNLSEKWRAAIADPDSNVYGFSAAHLDLIARLEPSAQDAVLGKDSFWLYPSVTVEDLNSQLAKFLHNLGGAPWDLGDAALVKAAGACSACSKRSSCRPGLFEEPAREPRKKGAIDQCLDIACWRRKEDVWFKRRYTQTVEKFIANNLPDNLK